MVACCFRRRAQDLSNTLWAFATLKYQPSPEWWRDFEHQVRHSAGLEGGVPKGPQPFGAKPDVAGLYLKHA